MEELKMCPFCESLKKTSPNAYCSFGKDFPDDRPEGAISFCLRHSADGFELHAEAISEDDEGNECCEYSGNAEINFCPICGKPLNRRAEPENRIVFKDGICPKCGGPTHGVNNGPMKCEDCGYEQPQTYLIEFTEDEITEFRHYLNAVKNRQSLDNDIRMSVFKLLHKFPNTLHTCKQEMVKIHEAGRIT